jgi:hypothetical protein
VIDYFQYVAGALPNVNLVQYGETYEHRPLVYAVIASEENFSRLEQIRLDNLKRTGMQEGMPGADKTAIVWLSYNVHGNESSSLEASMLTLYTLANPGNAEAKDWLTNTVVIIDPCINPDGRDRYANFYNQYFNIPANSSRDAQEHREPWPGGRANHYLFDLNRDWAWETQVESQQRIKAYHEWMPHVHVDFHEQFYNNPYYFAPAAEPFHEVITNWQREFQTIIGKNNAAHFDKHGWLYFTKERFDLFYPSYGDTYPTYNGAIGMTYEQGGGGAGGKSITTREGDPLTLRDRLLHHHTSGLSTVEITAKNAARVVDEFAKFFQDNRTNPAAPFKTYVIKGDNNPDKIAKLAKWMDTHAIQYGHPAVQKSLRGFDYSTQSTTTFNLSANDFIFNVYQPSSRFITTIFEPQSRLSDSLTYDITTWNLMYAFGFKAYATPERVNIGKSWTPATAQDVILPEKPYAYILKYESLDDVALLSALLKDNFRVRFAPNPFTVQGKDFPSGALLVTRRNNEHLPDFDVQIRERAKSMGRPLFASTTGFVEKGNDFGSAEVRFLKAPKVAILIGEQTYSLSTGEIWHFFEQQIKYPITQIGTGYFKTIDLTKYDVLIVPEGDYKLFDETTLADLTNWVAAGGRLILVGNALKSFSEKKGFGLKPYTTEDDKREAEKKEKEESEQDILTRYGDAERKQISEYISGAIYRITLDNSHPLSFGLNGTYYTLKTNELHFGYLEGGWNVGTLNRSAKPVQGFAGSRINRKLGNTLAFGVEENGSGTVVYLVDNPLFRCFWEDGKMLFANAVFLVGQ